MRNVLCWIFLALTAGAWAHSSRSASGAVPSKQTFAGAWWVKAEPEERSGFLNGVADCMTWTIHKKGFNATPEQLLDKISNFYRVHSELASLSVIDVWRQVEDQPKASDGAESQGETWKNAHWYLNGNWWSQVGEVQQFGFVEGYLWCLRTQAPDRTEGYSGSIDSYLRRIDAFVKANPKQSKEAVAVTLRRFRDQGGGKPKSERP